MKCYCPRIVSAYNHSSCIFSPLAGYSSSAWASHAKGELSAFPLPLAGLREQHVSLPWLPAYLSWQCLRLPRRHRTQTPVLRLFYDVALRPANQHFGRRWRRLALLHPEKLPGRAASRGLHKLSVQPHHLALSGLRGVVLGPRGLTSDDGRQRQPPAD